VVPPKLGLNIPQQFVLLLLIGDDFHCDLQKLERRKERTRDEDTAKPE
jgi:hypothetical protein